MNKITSIGFKNFSRSEKILIGNNVIYAFVLPAIDIFVASYIMRNSNDPAKVMFYQLAIYIGIPITFFINGYLLKPIY